MALKNKKSNYNWRKQGYRQGDSKRIKKIKIKCLACSRKQVDTSDLSSVEKFIKK